MVSPIFSGLLFFLDCCKNHSSTAECVVRRGGQITTKPSGTIHCAVISLRAEKSITIPSFCRLARIPVVYDEWVEECVKRNTLLPFNFIAKGAQWIPNSPFVVYDPFMFEDFCFTTTQLPRNVDLNVIAAMHYFGASYSPDLSERVNLVIFSMIRYSTESWAPTNGPQTSPEESIDAVKMCENDLGSSNKPLKSLSSSPSKLEVAHATGVTCVSPAWVQQCMTMGYRLPLPSASILLSRPPNLQVKSSPIAVDFSSGKRRPFEESLSLLEKIDTPMMRKRKRCLSPLVSHSRCTS